MKAIWYLLSILSAFLFLGISFAENQEGINKPKLRGKNIVMIIAHQMFEEPEFFEPKEIFEREGSNISVASSSLTESTGSRGTKVKPDILIDDINAKDFDAIVFIGGSGAIEYLENPQAFRIARQTLAAHKILAAICMAPRILANAGVIKGKKVTCFPSVREDIKAKGAIVTGEMVERDGNIITGNGIGATEKFAETIVSAMIEP